MHTHKPGMEQGLNGPPDRAPLTLAAVQSGAIALPWLGPWASGPSASVDQWLITGLCTAALAILWSLWPAQAERGLRWRSVAAGWLVAALGSTLVAFCQYYGVADLFPSLMSASPGQEPYANLRQRNQFASLTVIGTATVLWFATRGLAFVPALGAVSFLAAGNAVAASRAGALELLALTLLAFIWNGSRRLVARRLMVSALVAYFAAAVALPLFADRPLTYGVFGRLAVDEGCVSRRILWMNVLHLIAQKPWTGWGWGELDFAHYISLYPGSRFCDVLDNAHNLPLHWAVELGLPASILACLLLGWFVAVRAPWREADDARRLAWAVLTALGIHSLFEYPLWYGPFLMACCLCLWFLWTPSHERFKTGALRWPGAAAGLVLGGAVLLYGWQYRIVSQIYLPAERRWSEYRENTLEKSRGVWAFRDQLLFAELTTTPLTDANAAWTFDAAHHLLHFSPEPRVIEKLIESAIVLKRDDVAAFHMQRYRAAFPRDYERWLKQRG